MLYILSSVLSLVVLRSVLPAGAGHRVSPLRLADTAAEQPPLLEMTMDEVRSTAPEELDTLIGELEAAAANFVDASGGRPSAALSRLLATAHTCYGDHQLCVPHANAALAEDGEVGEDAAAMHFLLGVAAERRDEEDEALDQYEEAIALDPKCWRALFHVGKIAIAFGAIDMGIDHFRQVQAINADHAPTNAFLDRFDASAAADEADAAEGEGEPEEAEADVAELPPELPLPDGLQGFDKDPDAL